ncbi:MAG: hypothetical protein N2Z69_05200 [Methylophilaceae bacterium]|nr:hypothetical protein [Methylophilaceae bacterium]
MRRWLTVLLMTLGFVGGVQADAFKPDLLMYIHPDEYAHEVRLGIVPIYIIWARNGPALEAAARAALQPHFNSVGMCEGGNGADVVVWLRPQLTYNPNLETFYAKVSARFFRADGKPIGRLKATGTAHGFRGSRTIDAQVQQAYDDAMRQIAAQFAVDAALRQAIEPGIARTPCAMVALIPNP